jgi:threonylcarbamoyladenosine tRNA methylthiotransferase CDKAL1
MHTAYCIPNQLLDQVVAALPEGVMLRVGMTNPPHILEHVEAVAKVLNNGRLCVCIHEYMDVLL